MYFKKITLKIGKKKREKGFWNNTWVFEMVILYYIYMYYVQHLNLYFEMVILGFLDCLSFLTSIFHTIFRINYIISFLKMIGLSFQKYLI